jgi:hypothetical protein
VNESVNEVVGDLENSPREAIEKLQTLMAQQPQAPGLHTEHAIHCGLYYRKLFRPAGTLIVGKVHKKPHLFVCISGEIIAWSEKGPRHLRPGDVIESFPGTKRVTYALTDAVGMTVHHVEAATIEELESELVEPDETATFDFNNQPKPGVLVGDTPERLGA